MTTIKKIFLYLSLFIGWLLGTFLIMTTNFFEFNYPMSLMLLPLPFIAVVVAIFYLKKKS